MASDKLKFAIAKETIDRNADFDMTDEDMVTEYFTRMQPANVMPKNVSFFAFTATPKAETMTLFGRPTGNLDKKAGEDTLNLLSSCAARFGQTLIIVTHDLEIAKKADRIIKIEDGKIVSNQL